MIVTTFQLEELNRLVGQVLPGSRVHMRDTCGGQSFSVSPPRNLIGDGKLRMAVEDYFDGLDCDVKLHEEFFTVSEKNK